MSTDHMGHVSGIFLALLKVYFVLFSWYQSETNNIYLHWLSINKTSVQGSKCAAVVKHCHLKARRSLTVSSAAWMFLLCLHGFTLEYLIMLSIIALKLDFPALHLNTSSKNTSWGWNFSLEHFGNFDNLEYRIQLDCPAYQHWMKAVRILSLSLSFLCHLKVVLTVLCVYLNTRCDSAFVCKLTVLTKALFQHVNGMLSRCRSLLWLPPTKHRRAS